MPIGEKCRFIGEKIPGKNLERVKFDFPTFFCNTLTFNLSTRLVIDNVELYVTDLAANNVYTFYSLFVLFFNPTSFIGT